ncbi:LuxR C-terminal-related transcriptional regulator [Kitasatospora sp. NPDC048239]|uniref:LuxR C-terminal-related transcriptional regulator n=1 Tax=Kitasatospora sp. NPDC048239 TaxID=3364046 RepID=UPI0037221ED0
MSDEPGAAERALYLAAVAAGGHLHAADLTDLTPEAGAALDGLLDLGLLAPTATGYSAVSPRSAGDRLGAELRSEATRLLVGAERLPEVLEPLAQAYDAVTRPTSPSGEATHVEGGVTIRQRVAELLSDCKEELLAAQPGQRPAAGLRMAMPQDIALLRRGSAMRTLYQPVAAADRAVVQYAAVMTGHGARVRVLDEPYRRMLVFDRTVAVVAAADDDTKAVFVHDPAAVAFLVGVFERDWARATVVDWSAAPADPVTVRIGRLLAAGLTQRAVATRLGLSERTIAAHISRLRSRHGVQTLFQLGWRMRGEHRG